MTTKGNGSDEQAKPELKVLLTVAVRSDGALSFESAVPTKDALKLLQNVILEMMFQELSKKPESRIVMPNIVHGKPPDA